VYPLHSLRKSSTCFQLLAMDLLSFSMISFYICSSINTRHPLCLSFTFRVCALSIVFSASSGALRCVNIIFFQSLRKSILLIFLHLLHCFQPFLKVFWSSLQNIFLGELFLLTVNLLPSEFPNVHVEFSHCVEIFHLTPSLPLLFTTTPSFPLRRIFCHNSLPRQVSSCCFLLCRVSPLH
jgi:hypothetical protein